MNKNFVKLILFLVVCFGQLKAKAQDSILYSIEFKFNEGLFFDFEQVKLNRPIPFANVIFETSYKEKGFVNDLLKSEEITYVQNGTSQKIKKSQLWGYSNNGILYIQINSSFYRIPKLGKISFFVSVEEVEYYAGNSAWDSYATPYNNTYTTTEMRQFLMSYDTGYIYNYSIENVAKLISEDADLLNEFVALKKRKQKMLAFSFINRYNDKHPIYFPINN
ncbi:MAG: hypothetical protein JXR60_05225 [Bacteroidales bacterium]|nr:hypothetical protein [Bacteroidales bacterium]